MPTQEPNLNDPVLVYDTVAKGSSQELTIEQIETLQAQLADIEARLQAAGA